MFNIKFVFACSCLLASPQRLQRKSAPMSAAATLSAIGIADGLFLGTAKGFSCALKLQPADFEVRELDAVTHEPADITSHEAPAEPVVVHTATAATPTAAALAAAAVAAHKPAAVKESDAVPSDGWTAELQRLTNHSADTWQQLAALDAAGRAAGRSAGDAADTAIAAAAAAAAAAAVVVVPAAAGADKQQRARVHRAVTEVFPFVRTQWHKPAAASAAATAGAIAAGAAANSISSVVDAAVDNGTIECTPNVAMKSIAALLTPEQTEALQRFIQHTQPCKFNALQLYEFIHVDLHQMHASCHCMSCSSGPATVLCWRIPKSHLQWRNFMT
jgi:hypothetical protein